MVARTEPVAEELQSERHRCPDTAEGGTGLCAWALSRSQLGLCVPKVTGTARAKTEAHGSLALAGEHNVVFICICLICKSAANLHKHLMTAEFNCS